MPASLPTSAPRRSRLSVILLLLVALVAAACGSSTSSSHSGGSGPAAPTTLTIDMDAAPSNLDPGLEYNVETYDVYDNVYDPLIKYDSTTGTYKPWVATSWHQTNPTTWVFNIHPGIKFTNGEPLTGEDVAFSIERILNPSFDSAQYTNFSAIASATGTTNTVTIKTKEPSPTLLDYLSGLYIVPEQYVKKVGNKDFNLHPIGSGPYEVVSWTPDGNTILKVNPHYWNGKPEFAKVVFRAVTSDATEVADLKSGVAQIALQLTPDDKSIVSADSNLKAIVSPTILVGYLAMNVVGSTPTANLDVRKAVAAAINTSSLMKTVLDGLASPVNSMLIKGEVGYDPSIPGYKYDPAAAKADLAAAHDPHPTLVFRTSPSYPTDVIQGIQSELEAVGMKVKIVSTDQPTYLTEVQSPKHNWGSLRYGTWGVAPDADAIIYTLFRTGTIWSSFSNKAFDADVDAGRVTLNTSQRDADYARALTIMQNEVPTVPLWQLDAISGANKHLNFSLDSLEHIYLLDVHWQS